jgi:hypothetical protein
LVVSLCVCFFDVCLFVCLLFVRVFSTYRSCFFQLRLIIALFLCPRQVDDSEPALFSATSEAGSATNTKKKSLLFGDDDEDDGTTQSPPTQVQAAPRANRLFGSGGNAGADDERAESLTGVFLPQEAVEDHAEKVVKNKLFIYFFKLFIVIVVIFCCFQHFIYFGLGFLVR